MQSRYQFIIDSREHAKVKQLARIMKLPFIEEGLMCADFAVRDTTTKPWKYLAGIERKAVPDLIQSIVSHRLFDQIDRMYKTYDIAFLFISGSLDEHSKTLSKLGFKINPNVVSGTLTSIIVRTGIHVMWAPDDKTLLDWAYRTLEKISQGKYGKPIKRVPKYQEYNQVRILMKIPGVSRKKAEDLMKRFHSMKNIANASLTDLQIVDGVGPQTAHLIWKLFDQRF